MYTSYNCSISFACSKSAYYTPKVSEIPKSKPGVKTMILLLAWPTCELITPAIKAIAEHNEDQCAPNCTGQGLSAHHPSQQLMKPAQ